MSLDNQQRGRIAELKAIATCAARGWEIAQPTHLINCVYDIAVRRSLEEGWLKVQIKLAYYKKPRKKHVCELRRNNNIKYTSDDVDAFLIWNGESDTWYWLPYDSTKNQSFVTLDTLTEYQLPPEPGL